MQEICEFPQLPIKIEILLCVTLMWGHWHTSLCNHALTHIQCKYIPHCLYIYIYISNAWTLVRLEQWTSIKSKENHPRSLKNHILNHNVIALFVNPQLNQYQSQNINSYFILFCFGLSDSDEVIRIMAWKQMTNLRHIL